MTESNKRSMRGTASLTGSQRQQRYREAKKLCSIDISRETLALLDRLRARVAMSTDKTIAAALLGLAAELDAPGGAAIPVCVPASAELAVPMHAAVGDGVSAETNLSPGDIFKPTAPLVPPDIPEQPTTRAKRTRRSADQTPVPDQFRLDLGSPQPKLSTNTDGSDI